jgi:hypothetical protein
MYYNDGVSRSPQRTPHIPYTWQCGGFSPSRIELVLRRSAIQFRSRLQSRPGHPCSNAGKTSSAQARERPRDRNLFLWLDRAIPASGQLQPPVHRLSVTAPSERRQRETPSASRFILQLSDHETDNAVRVSFSQEKLSPSHDWIVLHIMSN